MSFKISLYPFYYLTGKVSKLIFENNIFLHRAHYKKIFQVKNFYFPIESGHNFQGLEDT